MKREHFLSKLFPLAMAACSFNQGPWQPRGGSVGGTSSHTTPNLGHQLQNQRDSPFKGQGHLHQDTPLPSDP